LTRLYAAVATSLRDADVAFDSKPFAPHVTLARARRDAGTADSAAIRRALAARASWGTHLANDERVAACQHITLMKSDLRPTGPLYTPLHRAHLSETATRFDAEIPEP
jgi:2'-5' RNA ligase